MSNWEKRPLRLSQQHYAALDAYCLLPILFSLAKIGAEKTEQTFQEHMKQHIFPLKYNYPKSGGFSNFNEENKDAGRGVGEKSYTDSRKYKKNKKSFE